MNKKSLITLLVMAAVTITFNLSEARSGLPGLPGPPGLPGLPGLPAPNVDVRVNGYLPAPPGVHVMMDSDRPYYVERDRRVYMERERPVRHYKKYKKHHRDHDRGHDNRHDRGRGRD